MSDLADNYGTMIPRICKLSNSNSFFLFGPRGVGKTTFLESWVSKRKVLLIDLLDPSQYQRYSIRPQLLITDWEANKPDLIVVDEIQKVPALLDVIQKQLHNKTQKVQFALTGSSARKLKRGSANLLGGRAFKFHLHPLTHIELGNQFNLDESLTWGGLPYLLTLDKADRVRSLYSYINTYLKEEILVEQIIRKIEPFQRFLEAAAQMNGKILNYSKISRDAGVDEKSVARYFQILEDTLIGFLLYPYERSIRKQQSSKAKFYFFDTGVTRTLQGQLTLDLVPQTNLYGDVFEHFVILEFLRLNDYYESHYKFSYIRTKDDVEVDLIIQRPGKPDLLIEIKSKEHFDQTDSKSLRILGNEFKNKEMMVLSKCKTSTFFQGVQYLHWQEGIRKAFA